MAMGVSVDFNANLVKFQSQVDKAVGYLDKFEQRSTSMASKVNLAMAALGVGFSAAGMAAAFVKSGIDAADALNDLADRSGIAVENLAGLQLAVKLGDTTMEAFVAASNKLSINMAKNAEDFAKLGITARDPVEAFKQMADVFSGIENPQTRAAFGAAALGKAYAEMAPLLMQGADGIQALIDKGREQNPITAEQAKQAGEFNDKLDILNNRLQTLSITAAGPVVDALNEMWSAFDFAMQKADGFHPLEFLTDYANGDTAANQIGRINYQIEQTQQALNALSNQGVGGKLIDAVFGGESAEELDAKLIKLQQMRAALQPKPQAQSGQGTAGDAFDKSLQAFIMKGDAEEQAAKKSVSAANTAAKAEDSRRKSVEETIAALERDIEISRLSEDQQKRALELSSALKNARGEEVKTITDLVNAKYNQIDVDKRQSAQWQQLIEDANAFYDLNKSIADFAKSDITTSAFGDQLGQVRDLLDAGVIDEGQAKAAFDKLGAAFNDGFIDPAKSGVDSLSLFSDQAARNMQTAFADFLFDPFEKGVDGMASGFINTLKRMAAEAASAQLMDGLFGKVSSGGDGGRDFAGGLIGSAFSAIGSAFFADGGIMTSAGPLPLRKYASGGVASSPQLALFGEGRMNEAYVPLPDGRSIPVTMNGGGGNVYNVSISVEGGRNPDETGQRVGEAFIRTIARSEIANQTRAGNSLNPTTRF